MSRSNGPLSHLRGTAPQNWQQQPADLDPAVAQAYAAAQAAAQPRYPQQGFGNVQGQPQGQAPSQPQYAPPTQGYQPQPTYHPQAPAPQPPADQGYYASAPAPSAPPQQHAYQPVFDRYKPATEQPAPRGYDPRLSQPQPQPPQRPAYPQAPQPPQPSLYDSHAQPPQQRGSIYDQWPQQAPAPATPPVNRAYDFSNYAPSAPAAQPPERHQAQPQHPAPQYLDPQHEEPQWQLGNPVEPREQFGQRGGYAAQQQPAFEQHQQYPAESAGQLQTADDQLYDDQDGPDYEEDEPRRGRRGLVMVSALVGAIALGGGLAFAYKKFVKPSGDGVQVAKVQAPKGPAKTQPADPGGKQFPNQDSKLQNRLGDGGTQVASAQTSDVDGGVKRVQTVQIGRDGSVSAPQAVPGMVVVQPQAAPPPPPPVVQAALEAPQAPIAVAPPPPQPRAMAIAPQPRVPVVNAAPADPVAAAPPPALKKPAAKKAPAARDDLVASAPGSAPAAVPVSAAPAKLGGGGYVAVLASRASKADAERTNSAMEQKYDVLKGKIFDVQEADLSAKGQGIVYRSVVGPPGSLAFASGICGQLKAAGYTDCWPVRY